MRRKYSLMEAIYGNYPESKLKPLNSWGVCTCDDECDCGAICDCGDPNCAQCGNSLTEAVLEEDEEQVLTDCQEGDCAGCSECDGSMQESSGCAVGAGYIGPMDEAEETLEE